MIAFNSGRPLRTWVISDLEAEHGAHGPTAIFRLDTTHGSIRQHRGSSTFWWRDTAPGVVLMDTVESVTAGHIGKVDHEWMETLVSRYTAPELVDDLLARLDRDGWEVNEGSDGSHTRLLCSRRIAST